MDTIGFAIVFKGSTYAAPMQKLPIWTLEHIKNIRKMHDDKIVYLMNNDTVRKIFLLLQKIGKSTTKEILESYKKHYNENLDISTVYRNLIKLEDKGLVVGRPIHNFRKGKTPSWEANKEIPPDEFVFLQDLQMLSLAIKGRSSFLSSQQVNTYGFPLDILKQSLENNEEYGKDIRRKLIEAIYNIKNSVDTLLILSENLVRHEIKKEIKSLESDLDKMLAVSCIYRPLRGLEKKWFSHSKYGKLIKIEIDLDLVKIVKKHLFPRKSEEEIWELLKEYEIPVESSKVFDKIWNLVVSFTTDPLNPLFVVAHSPKFFKPAIKAATDRLLFSSGELEGFGLGASKEELKEFAESVDDASSVDEEDQISIDELVEELLH